MGAGLLLLPWLAPLPPDPVGAGEVSGPLLPPSPPDPVGAGEVSGPLLPLLPPLLLLPLPLLTFSFFMAAEG